MFQMSELSPEARQWLTSKEALTATRNVQAKGLKFYAPSLKLSPLATEFVVTEQPFTIHKAAYSGSFSDLVWPGYFYPGATFPEKGLVRGRYTNTSNVPLAIRIRVIDLSLSPPGNLIAEEEVISTRGPNTSWDFWLPVAGKTVIMPDRDWSLQLQMLGYR